MAKAQWPTLYKKTATGAMQVWTIEVRGKKIITRFGQLGGAIQETTDEIKAGKNLGKKNETSAEQQAELEANAKWEKQIKKSYVEDKSRAEASETDHDGGVSPMLAHKFKDQKKKISYPAYVQPKLDGIRCCAVVKDGVCTLWTRTRKPITGVPHIERELERHYGKQGTRVFDGELYHHDFRQEFEKIVSFVRQEEPAKGHEVVQYHVYDEAVSELTFLERFRVLAADFPLDSEVLKLVSTSKVESEESVLEKFAEYLSKGYEGAMVRNSASLYENKRSYGLQKVKEFSDDEFKVIGIREGRGKLQGHAATFVCEMPNGTQFEAKMKGDTAMLKKYFDDHSLWNGQLLTVRYQGLTGANKVPRFPVGVALRTYE